MFFDKKYMFFALKIDVETFKNTMVAEQEAPSVQLYIRDKTCKLDTNKEFSNSLPIASNVFPAERVGKTVGVFVPLCLNGFA